MRHARWTGLASAVAGGPDLVVTGATLVTMDAGRRVVTGDLSVAGGRISAVGGEAPRGATTVIDGRGCVVLPGLVNAHMHETLERGWFEDLPFDQWLHDFALPKDRAYEARHLRAAAMLNQLEMIRNGTTTFIDIFRFPREAATVALRSGLRAVISPQIIDDPAGAGERLDDAIGFVDDWRSTHHLVTPWFGPHALYSCRPATFERAAAMARAWGVGLHTHLAEGPLEDRQMRDAWGCSPTERLLDLVGPGVRVLAAHAVHVSDGDMDRLATAGIGVAHCPTSNMKLGNGAAPVAAMRGAGITVGIGTDSNMTNNSLDMFEEMRQAALLAKLVSGDATALRCDDALWMATMGSAQALGLGDEIGSLEVGKSADFILMDLRQPHLWPVSPGPGGNIVAQVVYSATGADVRTTVVAGKVLMHDRVVRTLDADEVSATVHAEAADLAMKAGLQLADLPRG